jgi:hypothetical protein
MMENLERLQPKVISSEALGKALEKAEHYRLLNEPEEAESICLDVLAVEPDNQRARRTLVLALTDQFELGHGISEAREQVRGLTDEYERTYYTGIVCERRARAFLHTTAGSTACDVFVEAMEWYEKAEKLRPAGNDDCRLRWNSCLRTIRKEGLRPQPHDDANDLPLE